MIFDPENPDQPVVTDPDRQDEPSILATGGAEVSLMEASRSYSDVAGIGL